jgi:predicted SprT family Zn-dependent metalloprotease
MDTAGLADGDCYLKRSVLLVNEIVKAPVFRHMLKDHFNYAKQNLRDFNDMLKSVTFNTPSRMGESTYAETSRNTNQDTNYAININPRFKTQLAKNNSAMENNRVRFILAVTIGHELCHLFLRRHGMMYSPTKYRYEAGNFFEKRIFDGKIGMRLSDSSENGANSGWKPDEMRVTAVSVKDFSSTSEIKDSEITKLFECLDSKTSLKDMFPLDVKRTKRKRNDHAHNEAIGVHEGTRQRQQLRATQKQLFNDKHEHELDGCCGTRFSKPKWRRPPH